MSGNEKPESRKKPQADGFKSTELFQPTHANLSSGDVSTQDDARPSRKPTAPVLLGVGSILGPDQLIEKVGEGGMGTIYKAIGRFFAFITLALATAISTYAEHPVGLSTDDTTQIEGSLHKFSERIRELRGQKPTPEREDLVADAEIYQKAVVWALRYETKLVPADVALIKTALLRCQNRLDELAANKANWTNQKGSLVRGYTSRVDGSVQPFGLIIPKGYDSAKPWRLDVILHGSSKPTGLSELRFISRFDHEGNSDQQAADTNLIELHPLGRVENCYRWAGETDVFEAIEAVCRQYNVDRDRIVLRGMSMGASGTWHLGLKHPDRFVALGPYCGYVDTHEFSHTPLSTFVKVGPLPAHQEKALHMLDSIDYAANAGVVPSIACMGEKDVFFQAHVLMGKAMEREGLHMVNLISPGTGHEIDPKTHAEQMSQIKTIADQGLDHAMKQLRFVTWTLKYNRCHWVRVLGLEEHYQRAEFSARVDANGFIDIDEPKNITCFALLPRGLQEGNPKLRVGGQEVTLPASDTKAHLSPVIARQAGTWKYIGEYDRVALEGKRPGLQGPIDDAFTTPFLCVRGTGKAWNAKVQQWADANLKRFAYEWSRYFRGDLPVKNDVDVTQDDLENRNLILFGDPGSNALIARVLPKLPIRWTPTEVQFDSQTYAAADHAPALIHPNTLSAERYVVLNSGHTFHEQELASLNYLLFPRLGDWAILKVGEKSPATPSEPLEESVIKAGFFDEHWRP